MGCLGAQEIAELDLEAYPRGRDPLQVIESECVDTGLVVLNLGDLDAPLADDVVNGDANGVLQEAIGFGRRLARDLVFDLVNARIGEAEVECVLREVDGNQQGVLEPGVLGDGFGVRLDVHDLDQLLLLKTELVALVEGVDVADVPDEVDAADILALHDGQVGELRDAVFPGFVDVVLEDGELGSAQHSPEVVGGNGVQLGVVECCGHQCVGDGVVEPIQDLHEEGPGEGLQVREKLDGVIDLSVVLQVARVQHLLQGVLHLQLALPEALLQRARLASALEVAIIHTLEILTLRTIFVAAFQ